MRARSLALVIALPAVALAQAETDGNDLRPSASSAALPTRGRFERVGRPRGALRRTCDLTPFGGALYLAQANTPLGSDGARVFRYAPGPSPFSLAFDWNRPGEPARGGGGGQGFLRVRALEGRLAVPDADPPYGGLNAVDPGAEGYVFLSDRQGRFEPARAPGHRLPRVADLTRDRAGAAVLPRAYHVIDVIRWRGRWIASTGSVPPGERAWRGSAPGALHVGDDRAARWTFARAYPERASGDAWRLTYLTRFHGRLYAGLQDYEGREPNDLVVFDAPPAAPPAAWTQRALRVTPQGGAHTLRWFVDQGRLWWITLERDGRGHVRYTDDGEAWRELALGAGVGAPTDLLRWRGALVLLTEQGLFRVDGEGVQRVAPPPTMSTLARGRRRQVSHFARDDLFCASPLAVFRDELYAASQRDGSLWRLVAE